MDGSKSSYQPACWLHYYDIHTILFTKYYTLCCIQRYSQIHFIACSQVGAQDIPKYTPEYNLKYASNSTQWHIPSRLDSMLPGKLSRSVQVHSKYVPRYTSKDIPKYIAEQAFNNAPNWTWWYTRSQICSYVGFHDALRYTSKHALKYVSNCITWYTPNLLGSLLLSLLSRGKTLPISLDYMLPYMLLAIQLRDLKSCSHQAPGGRWWVVGSGGHIVEEIITSINIKVWTISLLCPPQWDHAMPNSYGIANHNFRFGRKSRKLDLRTQMF
jgi:hypothetical protein